MTMVAFANASITPRYRFFQGWEQLKSSLSANLVFIIQLCCLLSLERILDVLVWPASAPHSWWLHVAELPSDTHSWPVHLLPGKSGLCVFKSNPDIWDSIPFLSLSSWKWGSPRECADLCSNGLKSSLESHLTSWCLSTPFVIEG